RSMKRLGLSMMIAMCAAFGLALANPSAAGHNHDTGNDDSNDDGQSSDDGRDNGRDNDGKRHDSSLDRKLAKTLKAASFTGRVEQSLEHRLGRQLDSELADLGRLVFFDTLSGLHDDNTCAGCHAPGTGMGDSQSIAIGIQNN